MFAILWRRLDLPGHEVSRLTQSDDLWELSGTAVFAHDQRPCALDYRVVCDQHWRTRSAHIQGTVGHESVALHATVSSEQRWQVNGIAQPALDGCVDIDLGFSPSTNLLPIRRLALNIGEDAKVSAAWLPFPALTFEVLAQTYRREGKSTYRYESGDGAFVRVLDVNAAGFVTHYPDLWRAEAFAGG